MTAQSLSADDLEAERGAADSGRCEVRSTTAEQRVKSL
jgi:hypothetical protein